MDGLVPPSFDRHTVVLLLRPTDSPSFSEAELDRLQVEHLGYLRELGARGLLVANGPFDGQRDERLRGMSVYAAPPDEARRLAEADPMVRAGRLAVEVLVWMTAEGAARFPGDAWPRG
jgi:hypothetical protein